MRRTSALVLLTGAAGAYATASTFLTAAASRQTSFAAVDGRALAITLLAGWALVIAGTWATWSRPDPIGPITTLLGVTWWAPVWAGAQGDGSVLPSIAVLVHPFGPVLLLHLALVLVAGTVGRGGSRRWLAAAQVATGAYVLVRAVVRDPFLDRYCWVDCSADAFLLWPLPALARAVDVGWNAVTVLLGLVTAGVACHRLATSSPVGRRIAAPVLVPVASAGVAEAGAGFVLLWRPAVDPRAEPFLSAYLARGVAYTLVALGVGWTVVQVRLAERMLRHLTREWEDSSDPASLERSLATALGDSTAQVAFRIDAERGYVDVEGRPWDPPATGRLLTPIRRGEEEIAVVSTDPSVTITPPLLARAGDAARMTVDNERLRAGLLADVSDLRASRARIVTLSDQTRHRLERDLHDGAQQLLLALAHELRSASDDAAAGGAAREAAELERAHELARAAVVAVRELAHGIYPAVLSDLGLDAALRSVAESSRTSVRVLDTPHERFSPAVERTVHLVVSSSVAAGRPPDQLTVSVKRVGTTLVVRVRPVRDDADADLVDRVAAIGGRIGLNGETLWAEMPCG